MLNQVSEQKMHVIRWLLAVGWLTLIFSLFYDPITPHFTDPRNLSSPFHLDLNKCISVQDVCLQQAEYAIGARIFWGMIVPAGILILLLFGHEFWRRICPLSFFSQIPRSLGIQRKRKIVNRETGSFRYELFGVEKDSWLGRNYLYLQLVLFYLGLNIRILFVNSDRLALVSFLLLTIAASILVGYLFKGKSWCQYFCPMAPVQMFYTGARGGLLGSDAHLSPPQSITQSMCRTVDKGKEISDCVGCQSPCIDIDAERSYWEGITRPDQKLVFYSYFGLMLGFYCYYYLYSGGWDYYFSGAWNHEPGQLGTLLQPGFYIFTKKILIPKIIAAPITLAIFGIGSYFLCQTLENIYREYLKGKKLLLGEEQILHRCFTLCIFISFNVFCVFSFPAILRLLPNEIIFSINATLIFISTLWLRKTLDRSQELYTRESLADSLRRGLETLAVDWSKFLEGRSLKDLLPEQIYVLANVLPDFKRTDRLNVYQGVLQEALEDGKVHSANSLEVLKDVRKELGISDEEHYTVLKELGVLEPNLLDPDKQLTRENKLRLESYRRGLELLLLEVVEGGNSLQEAFERKQEQIIFLKQEYAITPSEQEQVLAEFQQNGALLPTGETLLAQLQDLAVCHKALNNLVPNPQAAVYTLLRNVVQEKQKLIVNQLLSIIEILGNIPEAMHIASFTGVLAENVIQEILAVKDEQSRWEERLSKRAINLLRQVEGMSDQSGATLSKISVITASSRISPITITTELNIPKSVIQETLHSEAIINVLLELLGDIEPLVQAASLLALHQINRTFGLKEAHRLMNSQIKLNWLVQETVERICGRGEDQQIAQSLPTLIAQVRTPSKTERRVFQQKVIRVGRNQDNDIAMLDSRISRQHAIFYLDRQGVSVKDLGSVNGVRIGSKLIQNQQQQLKPGDVVRFSTGEDLVIHVQWEMQVVQEDTMTKALSTLDKLLFLYQSSFFQGLQGSALIELAKNSEVRVYQPGQTIYQAGDPAKELLVLIDGRAEVRVNVNGQEEMSEILPGHTIGELGVLTHRNRYATVVATATRTRALGIDAKDFETVLASDRLLAKNLLLSVSTRLQDTLNQNFVTPT